LSFDPLRHHPRIRKASPWVVYGAVIIGVATLAPGVGSVGVVAAQAEVHQAGVFATRAVRVDDVKVKPGDRVKKGDVLVVLDGTSVAHEVAVAKAELEMFKANAVAEEIDLRGTDLESSARLAQEADKAAVDLATLVAQEKNDRAELKQVEELIARQEELVAKKLANAEQRDELKLHRSALAQRVNEYGNLLRAARAHEAAAKERLKAWRNAREKGDDVKDGGTPTSSPLEARSAPARAEAAAQVERVRLLEQMLDDMVLKAPIDGTVAEVLGQIGDTARLDLPVVTVVDEPKRVIAWVDERAASRVKVGDRVYLRASDRTGAERNGVVESLAPAILELPIRFRIVPTQPSFGRAVYITIEPQEGASAPLPGQAFDVVFRGSAG
jgi:multidrug resistance efflux pump